MNARMGRATARVPLQKPELLKAPLFGQLVDQLTAQRRWIVLDLAASSSPLLELLAESRSRVEVADLYGTGAIDELNRAAEEDPGALGRMAEQVLPAHDPAVPVDVVLCWDLFNYIEPPAIAALVDVIERRARPGTLTHGLVAYAETEMPAEPGRFRPLPDSRLIDAREVSGHVEAPRYTPAAWSRMMGRFVLERAMLLGNGMQELLFRLQ